MAQHDNEHAHAWTCSDTLAQALRGHTDLSPADQLALLVAQGADRLPLPGHGHAAALARTGRGGRPQPEPGQAL